MKVCGDTVGKENYQLGLIASRNAQRKLSKGAMKTKIFLSMNITQVKPKNIQGRQSYSYLLDRLFQCYERRSFKTNSSVKC